MRNGNERLFRDRNGFYYPVQRTQFVSWLCEVPVFVRVDTPALLARDDLVVTTADAVKRPAPSPSVNLSVGEVVKKQTP